MGNYFKKNVKKNHNRGLAAINALVSVVVLCLMVFYLIQVNSLVSYSYHIRDQKEKIENLEKEKQEMEMEVVQLRGLDNLEEKIKELGMVETSGAMYWDWGQKEAMAKR